MSLFKKLTSFENYSSSCTNFGLLFLRLMAGGLMAYLHGSGKVPPNEGFAGFLGKMGFPAPMLFAWAAGLSELAGSLLIMLGLFTRPAALTLVCTMGVAVFMAHGADPLAKKELALLYGTIAMTLFFTGAGRYSLDRVLNKK